MFTTPRVLLRISRCLSIRQCSSMFGILMHQSGPPSTNYQLKLPTTNRLQQKVKEKGSHIQDQHHQRRAVELQWIEASTLHAELKKVLVQLLGSCRYAEGHIICTIVKIILRLYSSHCSGSTHLLLAEF